MRRRRRRHFSSSAASSKAGGSARPLSPRRPFSGRAAPPVVWPRGTPERVELAENCLTAARWVFGLTALLGVVALPFVMVTSLGFFFWFFAAMLAGCGLAVSGCAGNCRRVTAQEQQSQANFLQINSLPANGPTLPAAALSPTGPAPGRPARETVEEQRRRLLFRAVITESERLDEEARFRRAMRHGQPTPEDLERARRTRALAEEREAQKRNSREAESRRLETLRERELLHLESLISGGQ